MKYDRQWSSDPGYVFYDFHTPKSFDPALKGAFDVVVIDPPFITKEVWEKYEETALFLLRRSPFAMDTAKRGLVLATTVAENAPLLRNLFGAEATAFRPKITNLVYQYNAYVNCLQECTSLNFPNPELRG